jgi:hypothetical protein
MPISIDCKITLRADSIEEAVKHLHIQLMNLVQEVEQRNITGEYHFWNKENEGDVDWYPIMCGINDGSKKLHYSVHVENVRG